MCVCVQSSGGDPGLPQWLVSIIVMSSCATLSLLMLAVNRIIRYFQLRNAGERRFLHCLQPCIPMPA
jgi:hypothetical protein